MALEQETDITVRGFRTYTRALPYESRTHDSAGRTALREELERLKKVDRPELRRRLPKRVSTAT